MMKRIRLIATRDFLATAGSKGFLVGLLLLPAMVAIAAALGPLITNARSPQIRGDIAVIDGTARVTGQLRQALDPATLQSRRAARGGRAPARGGAPPNAGQVPVLRVLERPADADVEREKKWLVAPAAPDGNERHLALVVIHRDAVVRADGQSHFGAYDLYVSGGLDDNTEGVIYDALRQSLVNARIEASRLDPALVEATMHVARPRSVIVVAGGEQPAQRGFKRALPFIMGILLFLGIMVGGQTLMTSTIEEKSSRVVEVLLAAVSPVELMAGKLLGQLGVGLLVMGVHVAVGIAALFRYSMLHLLDPTLVLYLMVFFLLSYLLFGALMSAIGAAVDQLADAQSLMGPVMLMLLAPYLLTPIIGRAPSSTLSVALSFIPPINSFAMLARLASDAPPPLWQVGATVLVGLAAAMAAIWFAAKIFKVGLLMHGKPPSVATLIRWARMA